MSNAAHALSSTVLVEDRGAVAAASLPDDPGALKAVVLSMMAAFDGEVSRRVQEEVAACQVLWEARLQDQLREQLEAQKKDYEARILRLYEQVRLMRQRMFGPSSEASDSQGWLFNEAELVAAKAPDAAETVDLSAAVPSAAASATPPSAVAQKARGKRGPLSPELPRVDVIHDVPEAERICPCGKPKIVIGEDISEQLDIVPMKVQVLRHRRLRYACPEGDSAPVVAPAPLQVLPKSNASNDFLAMMLTVKYADGLPLARIEKVLARFGANVPRQTLARWAIGTAQALQPLFNLMRDTLLDHDVMHMDETPVQVLKEAGRKPTSQSQMWVQRGGPAGRPIVLFNYDPTRAKAVPVRLLDNWKGFLMTDGLGSYNAVVRQNNITHLGCWAHARRPFANAAKLVPAGKTGRAHQALAFIAKLYAIEKQCRGMTVEERFAVRQTQSKAVLHEFKTWLDEVGPTVPPKEALGKALGYLSTQWPRLVRFIERGDLPIDNNPAENAIRPFVIGRKAWLFADTPAGANASALIYSLIETAKANGQEPYLWLSNVLRDLPAATSLAHYEALLPWNQAPANLTTCGP